MESAIAVISVFYALIGIAVYAFSDTTAFASRIESLLVVVPFGVVQSHLFVFVVALWPVWLVGTLSGRPPSRD